MISLGLRLIVVFVVGACFGSFVNWAIYALAWTPRQISPWFRPQLGAESRRHLDRMPVIGWFWLRREVEVHGTGFWIRPFLLEIWLGLLLAGLYWWEVGQIGLIRGQLGGMAIVPPIGILHLQFASHALLLCWMLAASFVDIDEKIIPDEITVTGTLLGLLIATVAPMSLLPHVVERAAPSVVGLGLTNAAGAPAIGVDGKPLWLEPVTVVAPNGWPPAWGGPGNWTSLAIGLGCYWLWCFALAPRIWRGRRGARFAVRLIAARLNREFGRPPLRWLLMWGTAVIVFVWATSAQGWSIMQPAWAGLLSTLVGLAASGGIVWAVRLIGSFSLRREAMGFGDVTLMMMIGTFLGWQACLILFFISPFAALVIGIIQFIARRDDVIPFGPFLCLAAAVTVVWWAPIWMWAQPMFEHGALVPLVLTVCLILLGVMLTIWRMIKSALFGDAYAGD